MSEQDDHAATIKRQLAENRRVPQTLVASGINVETLQVSAGRWIRVQLTAEQVEKLYLSVLRERVEGRRA